MEEEEEEDQEKGEETRAQTLEQQPRQKAEVEMLAGAEEAMM